MVQKPTPEEIRSRIMRETGHFGGVMPERTALAWDGYLAALVEWGLISVSEHAQLCDLLPKIEDNPVLRILLGREDESFTAKDPQVFAPKHHT